MSLISSSICLLTYWDFAMANYISIKCNTLSYPTRYYYCFCSFLFIYYTGWFSIYIFSLWTFMSSLNFLAINLKNYALKVVKQFIYGLKFCIFYSVNHWSMSWFSVRYIIRFRIYFSNTDKGINSLLLST